MTLGERIKALRKEQGLTLVDLAGSKITKGMLSLIENNKSKPSMDTLEYLAEELGVTVSYLTQEGDSEWTKEVLERSELYNAFDFPTELIKEEILPNMDKIAQSNDGMVVYHLIRVYYRYTGQKEKAEEITDLIEKFYKSIGLEHLAVTDKMNNAVSMLYERDYKNAYETIKQLEDEVEKFKDYDNNIYLNYLFWRSSFAADFDREDFLKYGELHIQESYKMENFKYYYLQNLILGLYYSHNEEWEKAEEYQENIRKYLLFNQSDKYRFEVLDRNRPISVFYLLNQPDNIIEMIEEFLKGMTEMVEGDYVSEEPKLHQEYIKQYLPVFDMELAYFKEDYNYVLENFSYKMYERPQAQHPLDRILFAVRSLVYPLSLFETGKVEEAREAYNLIEEIVADIKDSIYAKEMHMIKEILFK
ncbi:transcriptional regulator [Jeotgalicoccus coquinae]|uniref:Transcriptional regulator with XRE-family HTH domain n=1 Tax=Jeotgalicoccus coquinae TaxID=709509 RepID=A0A6V7RRR1_9STAP|nr:helix-turn-helix transcriptional regulator [Jeotgalicoccus coquinae]MBB6423329.1 transcriptional regulator with XRE-family HTH domain [Jeotgalicoccus coquinae]GGE08908.1 transcriptional regulator [Jeotgalicoccus coquinae]CAD2081727.1 hypothetical protein JEOCOQ751_02119 [Jeotgalicoccus coquinae]